MWQAVEIGWTKPKEAPADWDEEFNNISSRRALNALFSVVTNEEFKNISSRRFGPSFRQPMRELRLSKTQSFSG